MTEGLDERAEQWPLRPWIMAVIAAIAGLLFHWLTDHDYSEPLSAMRQAGATFVAIATVSFILTIERRRWLWALGFASAWGLVIALVGWFTASYNHFATVFEWPYLSGLFAVMLAAPLFQTVRDEGAWRFPYARLHKHAWTDAVIGAASLMFTGIVFLLAWLIAGLFDLIGIEAVRKLLQKEWFGWMLAGFAFGAAVGLLREREGLLATLRRLVMIVYSVLAPVLAVALVLFLASIPFTGLDKLWDSGVPATPLLLLAGAGAILLANAVIGDGREERSPNRILQWSALVLVAVVLPLAGIAALSMGIRVGEYGWTPERISGASSQSPSRSLMVLGAGGRSGVGGGISTTRCGRFRPGSRSACADWRCSWRFRSSISARSRPSRSLHACTTGKSRPRSSIGGQWRSTSGPRDERRSNEFREPAQRTRRTKLRWR